MQKKLLTDFQSNLKKYKFWIECDFFLAGDLLKEQNPSTPITQRRNSSVSYGKKKGAE